MVGQVPSSVARAAKGSSVTPARLRGEPKYYPKSIHYVSDSETLHYLILLTTNTGYGFNAKSTDTDNKDLDVTGCQHRLNVMAVSDERIQLITGSGSDDYDREVISYEEIESIHGTLKGDRYYITIINQNRDYFLNTAKKKRLNEFREALDYVSRKIKN